MLPPADWDSSGRHCTEKSAVNDFHRAMVFLHHLLHLAILIQIDHAAAMHPPPTPAGSD